MPRSPRRDTVFSTHHVMIRGNNKQPVFFDEIDYRFFYKLLDKMVCMYGCKIHLFCLMTNHVHLVIEVDFVPLNKIMQCLQSEYTGYINRIYKRHNHLFGGRFRSKKVHAVSYFIELCHYIHLNPVKANIVPDVDCYEWSSHLAYLKKTKIEWLTTDFVYSMLKSKIDAVDPYRAFMYERDKFYDTPNDLKFDKNGFLVQPDIMLEKTKREGELNLSRLTLDEIINIICDTMAISRSVLISDARLEKLVIARSLVAYYGHYFGGYQLKLISAILFRQSHALSKTMHKVIGSSSENRTVAYWMKNVEQVFLRKLIELNLPK